MNFKLPKLDYDYSALEPHIDAKTVEIHHGKHHAAYVAKLNDAIEGKSEFEGKTIEEVLTDVGNLEEDLAQAVINNGGGHANHGLYWEIMGPGTKKPEGELKKTINDTFGGLEAFKEKFTEKAMAVFGSGWAFLQVDGSGKLEIKRHSFQNSPWMYGKIPVLALDVWEHAYYLKYKNRKDEYIKAFWQVVNWRQVSQNFLQDVKS